MTTFTAYTIESATPEAQKILTNIKAGYGGSGEVSPNPASTSWKPLTTRLSA